MGFRYYLSVWLDEFNSRWTYHNCKNNMGGPICGDEVKILNDLASCSPASDYLETSDLNKMRQFLESGVMGEDVDVFARSAKFNAKIGKKWCVDILLVSIKWSITNGPGIIKDATIAALL